MYAILKTVQKKEHHEQRNNMELQNNIDLQNLESLKPLPFTTNENGHVVLPEGLRAKLLQEIDAGYVTPAANEDGDMVMLKYSKNAMYDQTWNDTVINFRGVLTDASYHKVFARGFTKFFNVAEHENNEKLPDLPADSDVVLAKKMDGSLGLITVIDGNLRVFTSGSARRNEIAEIGEKILQNLMLEYGVTDWRPPENTTILVEIISERNPIVVDYGGERRLVALGAVDNLTGVSLTDEQVRDIWFGEMVEKINDGKPMSYADSIAMDIPNGEEGFVLEFQGDYHDIRAKVKGEEYLLAHKIMTNLSIRQLWIAIDQGTIDEILENTKAKAPQRAYDTLVQARDALLQRAEEIIDARVDSVGQYIADYNAEQGTAIEGIEDLPNAEKQQFVKGLQQLDKKQFFTVDMQIARQNMKYARRSAFKMVKPKGETVSILTLLSAEKVEVGDDMDDQQA